MEVKIVAIGSIEESPCYLVGKISSNNYVVFDLLDPSDFQHFTIGNIVKIEDISEGPVSATNKTKGLETGGICIHALNIDGNSIRREYFRHF